MTDEQSPIPGAVAPEDTALRDAVADVLRLSASEREYFAKYTAVLCDEQLEQLVAYVNNPSGKRERLIQEVIGEILLIYHQKMQLQAARTRAQSDEQQREIWTLRTEVQELSRDCRALQSENSSLRSDLREVNLELSKALESNDKLKALQGAPAAPVGTATSYRAPQPSHFLVSGPSFPESRPILRLDKPRSPTRSREDQHQVLASPGSFKPTSGERNPPRSSRARQELTSSPSGREDDRRYHHREYGDSDDSDGPGPINLGGLRTRQIESLAKDVERFNPDNHDSSIDDYLREIDRCLLDLSRPSSREKLKLVWKTTTRNVHVFMETLQPSIRDRYSSLCHALREEYSMYTDPASATLSAFAISQRKLESPRDYFRRLRSAYFQGRNAPGLEEDHAFKSLFLHNLHDNVRYDVTMHCRTSNLTMPEIRKYAQLAWETRGRPMNQHDDTDIVLSIQQSSDSNLALEDDERPWPSEPWSPPRNKRPWRSKDPRDGERRPQGQHQVTLTRSPPD